jgi:hypothetical protein
VRRPALASHISQRGSDHPSAARRLDQSVPGRQRPFWEPPAPAFYRDTGSRVPLTGSWRKEDFPGGQQALARRPQPRDPQVLRPATPRLFRRRSSSPPVPRFRPATAGPVQPSVGTKTDALGSFRGRLWNSPPWESRFAWAGRPHGRRHPVQVRRLNRASLRSLLARREFAH